MWSEHRPLEDSPSGYSKTLVSHMIFIVLSTHLHRFLRHFDTCLFLAHRTAILIDTVILWFDRSHVPGAVAIGFNCLLRHVFLATFFQRRNEDLFVAFEVLLLHRMLTAIVELYVAYSLLARAFLEGRNEYVCLIVGAS